jgi:Putative adhesin
MRKPIVGSLELLGLLIVAAAASARPAASWNAVRGRFERTFSVSGPVELEIKNGSGDIVVREGGAGTVQIRAKIYVGDHWFGTDQYEARVHAIEANPPVDQFGNSVRIHDLEEHDNISIDYEISVPADTRVHSETGSGDVTVEGISGPAEVQTGSGDVTMHGVHGNVRAQTGSGDTKFDGIDAERVEIKTGSGDVELRDLRCALEAHTGSGDIRADGRPTGRWRLDTSSGEVKLHLPSDLGFDLEAHTGSGDVHAGGNLSLTVQGSFGHGELRGKARGGGVPVEVQTGSGDIVID